MAYYLDTSAFLKLVTTEPETPALRSWVQRKDPTLFSSDLLRTEAFRAARRYSAGADRSARRRLEALTLLSVTADVCGRAGDLDPAILGSFDALHFASVLSPRTTGGPSSPTASGWACRLACMESQSWRPAGGEGFGDTGLSTVPR
jgi:hypothetical protein